MILTIVAAISLILLIVNLVFEYKRDLMMLQQNSYRPERYMGWLRKSGDSTSVIRLIALVVFFIDLYAVGHQYFGLVLAAFFAIYASAKEAKAKYKKPLAWTARVKRIYTTVWLLTAVIAGIVLLIFKPVGAADILYMLSLTMLGAYCASHVMMIVTDYILSPVEKLINRKYYNQARDILRQMPDLKIVGITGSYGKTSTKHYLYRILSEQFDTLMTPGSYNTTLGVIRTIREYLKPYNEIFIVEMGAKARGDIKEICDLVNPGYGIITAVGPQHLESFRTIDNVQATKFELADAIPADGFVVVNDDFNKIADRKVTNTTCLRYGVRSDDAPYRAENVIYTSAGTEFDVTGPDGWQLSLKTRLMGECNVSDLLAAVVMAHKLGVPDSKIAVAVASIEPVEHRLSVKSTPGGITILDDAFNSNPVGSKMAVEVLGSFKTGKRIIITPGMIELGSEQFDLNFEFGKHIGQFADVAIIVGAYNREAIVAGIKEIKDFPQENIYQPSTFAEAQQILAGLAAKGDVVLYENDLPDTFK